jgi:predicted short-subunit dehydrogenase-like oxidoreductase (DUF2520 family)
MRQVLYVIIGAGRVATHIKIYLQSLNLPFRSWSRQSSQEDLTKSLHKATHVLLLISDGEIEGFIEANPVLQSATLIHFSGALQSPRAHSAHPLFSFTQNSIDLTKYTTIPFVIDEEGPSFAELLPGFPNPHYRIPRFKKAYYHSLCVLADNFTTLLWQKFFKSMKETIPISDEHLNVFLEQSFLKIVQNPESALTGPIARNDRETLLRNLEAMKEDECYEIFASFVNTYTGVSL